MSWPQINSYMNVLTFWKVYPELFGFPCLKNDSAFAQLSTFTKPASINEAKTDITIFC